MLRELHAKGVDLFLHQQGLDTSTVAGRMMFQMLGVIAEFERGMIRERVMAGQARAKKDGKHIGRKFSDMTTDADIRRLRAEGYGKIKIAKTLKVGVSTVQRVLGK